MSSVRCDLGVAAVVTNATQVLLVKEATGRYSGHWGLPKGYVDDGELPRDAALRELKEECDVAGKVTGIYAVSTSFQVKSLIRQARSQKQNSSVEVNLIALFGLVKP